jgi:hypothetical protein
MTEGNNSDVRHEGTSFDPVPRDQAAEAGLGGSYPPEADPARRLTGGDQPAGESEVTQDDLVTPGSVEPPD